MVAAGAMAVPRERPGPDRSPRRVRNRLHAGFGRFPRTTGGRGIRGMRPVRFRAGTLRASLARSTIMAGFPNGSKTRIRRTGYGVEQLPCRRRARQRPVPCAERGPAHPPSCGRSPLGRRMRLLPQSAGVMAEPADPRVVGTVSGIVRYAHPVESCDETSGSPPAHCRPRRGERGGAGRRARRIRGAGAPHRHAPTHTRGVTQGREHPARRGNHPVGWVACAGFGDARPTARWCNGSTPALWREVRVRIPWRAPLRRITHTSGRATCTGERTLPARPADPLCDPPSDQPLPVPIPRAHRRHRTRTSSRTQPASDTTTRQEYQ